MDNILSNPDEHCSSQAGNMTEGDYDNQSMEEKVAHLWALYQQSENELTEALERLDASKQQHEVEMREIEAYVEQIRSLSDERENITAEFERENEELRGHADRTQNEVSGILEQQGLTELTKSSLAEIIAYLCLKRAELLDEAEKGTIAVQSGRIVHSCSQCTQKESENRELKEQLISTTERLKLCEKRVLKYKNMIEGDAASGDDHRKLMEQQKSDLQDKVHMSGGSDLVGPALDGSVSAGSDRNLVESLKEQIRSLRSEHEREIMQYQNELEQVLSNHEEELERADNLHSQLEEASDANQDIGVKLEEVHAENEILKGEVSRLMDENNETLQRLDSVTSDYDSVITHLDNLNTQHQQLQVVVKKSQSDYEALQQVQEIMKEDCELMLEEKSLTNQNTAHLQKETRLANQRLVELEAELEKTKETSRILHEEKEGIVRQFEGLMEENLRLKEKLEESESTQDSKLAEVLERLSRTEDEVVISNRKLAEKSEQIVRFEAQLLTASTALMNATQTISEMEAQVNQLNTSKSKLESGVRSAESELATLRADISSGETARSELMTEMIALTDCLTDVETESSELKRCLANEKAEVGELLVQLNVAQEERDGLEVERNRLADELEGLQDSPSNEKTAELDNLNYKLSELYNENQSLEQKVSGLTNQNATLTDQLANHTQNIEQKDQQITRFNEQMTATQSENDLICDKFNRTSDELTRYKGQLEDRLHVVSRLEKQVKRCEKELADAACREVSMKGELETIREQAGLSEELALQISELNEELEQMRLMADSKDAEIRQLTADHQEAVEQLEKTVADFEESRLQDNYLEETRGSSNMDGEASLKDRDLRIAELTDRLILLEKAANQLEEDNHELALKLKDALGQTELAETNLGRERNQLKSSNSRLLEQIERMKKYGESVEKDLEFSQEKHKSQTTSLKADNEAKEAEVLSLKTELTHLKSDNRRQVDSLQQKLQQAQLDNRVLQDSLNTKLENLVNARREVSDLRDSLEGEKSQRRAAETRVADLQAEHLTLSKKLKEVQDRRLSLEQENHKLASELDTIVQKGESAYMSNTLGLTDSTKALELAESRLISMEKQRDDLRINLHHVNMELTKATDSLKELTEVKQELQTKRDEMVRLKTLFEEERTKRIYGDNQVESLKLSLESVKEREKQTHENSHHLRHKLLDLEAQLSSSENKYSSTSQEVSSLESKVKSLLQKMSSLQEEKETLELELLAANEKLSYSVKRYYDRKAKDKGRMANRRLQHVSEVAKLRDRVEYLERDLKLAKSSLERAETSGTDSNNRCSSLFEDKQNFTARIVDLEDEIRERNRAIALLQTKLQYTERENLQLEELCDKLKVAPKHSTDILDTLLTKQYNRVRASPRSRDFLSLGPTTSMESLVWDSSRTSEYEKT